MILKEIILKNFRVFSGIHQFDLTPRGTFEQPRPIILFGGLNGSGKTTLLAAVRLGLYGKQSLSNTTSIKEYHEYLANCIHKNPQAVVPLSEARIELVFNYARQGTVEEYRVIRSWQNQAGRVTEKLGIARDGELLEDLSSEQCQAFLNELIPVGVSDLFFFDGEKIAALAEDDSGQILQQAVKKLLGLDMIERLRNDLSLWMRKEQGALLPDELQSDIQDLEKAIGLALVRRERAMEDYERLNAELTELKTQANQIESTITLEGGDWAQVREEEKARQNELIAERKQLVRARLEAIAGAYPLSFAKTAFTRLLADLKQINETKKKAATAAAIKARLEQVQAQLQQLTDESARKMAESVLQAGFSDLLQVEAPHDDPRFDLSDAQIAKYEQWVTVDAEQSCQKVDALNQRLQEIDAALESSSLRLEAFPTREDFQDSLNRLKTLSQRQGELRTKACDALDEAKKAVREAMELNRRVERAQQKIASGQAISSGYRHAKQISKLLTEFGSLATQRRVTELEHAFVASYKKLARKEDLHLTAQIDPVTFDIQLQDEHGHHLAKADMSAGEKQIYAIAILEALAKTSGRKLPIIIDTPLGRLDSQHRDKLIQHYFPQASHQVIILSTDTEIDQDFYTELEGDISHAYHIDFDQKTRTSTAKEGYFWKSSAIREAI